MYHHTRTRLKKRLGYLAQHKTAIAERQRERPLTVDEVEQEERNRRHREEVERAFRETMPRAWHPFIRH
jgi:hypothetical protein